MFNHIRIEADLGLEWNVILVWNCNLSLNHVLVCLNGLNSDLGLTIRTVSSDDLDLNTLLFSAHIDLSLFETKDTWLVVLKNCDSCFTVISFKFCTTLIANLHHEVLVWGPLGIVLHLDVDLALSLHWLESQDHILSFIVFSSHGLAILSPQIHIDLFVSLIANSDGDEAILLGHLIFGVLESNLRMVVLGLMALNSSLTSDISLDLDKVLLIGCVLGELAAEGNTLNWVLWAENFHDGINADALVDLLNSKHLLKKILDLRADFLKALWSFVALFLLKELPLAIL